MKKVWRFITKRLPNLLEEWLLNLNQLLNMMNFIMEDIGDIKEQIHELKQGSEGGATADPPYYKKVIYTYEVLEELSEKYATEEILDAIDLIKDSLDVKIENDAL